jgi:hypothetical protein
VTNVSKNMGNLQCCVGKNAAWRQEGTDENRSSIEATSDAEIPNGISVHCLEHCLMKEVQSMGFSPSSKIYEIENLNEETHGVIRTKGAKVICPFDGTIGSAYVDALGGIEDYVGPATIMLSYSWSYGVGDIVQTLSDYCEDHDLDPKRTYVWICCLCINQHRVAESKKNAATADGVSFEEFQNIFHDRVTKIRHILAMMSPWSSPLYLVSSCCLDLLLVS